MFALKKKVKIYNKKLSENLYKFILQLKKKI